MPLSATGGLFRLVDLAVVWDRWRRVLLLSLAFLVLSTPASATEVRAACPELSAEDADELLARVRLTLQPIADAPRPRSLLVACNDAGDTWVIWDGPPAELLPVDPERERTEGVLLAIEAKLAPSKASAAQAERVLPPKPPQNLDGPERRPSFPPRPEQEPSAPRIRLTHGGLGLGLAGEVLGSPLSPTFGPRLDVGVGWGPLSLLIAEGARGGGGRDGQLSTFGFDAMLGAGWGAPFDTRYPFGAALMGGVDWLSVHSSGTEAASRTKSSGVASAGVRGALYAGDVALWLGLDARYRFKPQSYGGPINVNLPHFTALTTLSAALVVDVRQHEP
jgi:hypothetical protein